MQRALTLDRPAPLRRIVDHSVAIAPQLQELHDNVAAGAERSLGMRDLVAPPQRHERRLLMHFRPLRRPVELRVPGIRLPPSVRRLCIDRRDARLHQRRREVLERRHDPRIHLLKLRLRRAAVRLPARVDRQKRTAQAQHTRQRRRMRAAAQERGPHLRKDGTRRVHVRRTVRQERRQLRRHLLTTRALDKHVPHILVEMNATVQGRHIRQRVLRRDVLPQHLAILLLRRVRRHIMHMHPQRSERVLVQIALIKHGLDLLLRVALAPLRRQPRIETPHRTSPRVLRPRRSLRRRYAIRRDVQTHRVEPSDLRHVQTVLLQHRRAIKAGMMADEQTRRRRPVARSHRNQVCHARVPLTALHEPRTDPRVPCMLPHRRRHHGVRAHPRHGLDIEHQRRILYIRIRHRLRRREARDGPLARPQKRILAPPRLHRERRGAQRHTRLQRLVQREPAVRVPVRVGIRIDVSFRPRRPRHRRARERLRILHPGMHEPSSHRPEMLAQILAEQRR